MSVSCLPSKPGVIWCFVLVKNSLRKRQLKFSIVDPLACCSAVVDSKTNSSALVGLLYEVTPLNPLTHPVNPKVVIPVYVIISSLIYNNP